MNALFITAFVLGGLGSVHCIGMCGSLAFSLPVVSDSHASRFVSTLLYNLGRVTTYAFLGAVFGIIGGTFALFGYQQWLSIILGIVIIIFIILPKNDFAKRNVVMIFFEKIRATLGNLFIKKKYHSLFFIGLLNGLLPCGMVYLAIAGAISTASVFTSSLFMAAFGLGTLPVMWCIAFFGGYINLSMRKGIKKLYPYFMFFMAVLLILRGLGLNIHYISPLPDIHQIVSQQKINCHD